MLKINQARLYIQGLNGKQFTTKSTGIPASLMNALCCKGEIKLIGRQRFGTGTNNLYVEGNLDMSFLRGKDYKADDLPGWRKVFPELFIPRKHSPYAVLYTRE